MVTIIATITTTFIITQIETKKEKHNPYDVDYFMYGSGFNSTPNAPSNIEIELPGTN